MSLSRGEMMSSNVPRTSVKESTKNGSEDESQASSDMAKKVPRKGGRKGDPRMNRAVRARLADPKLSLVQALRIGGFNYPVESFSHGAIVDKESISLCQRKNQLLRRCRLAKQSGRMPPLAEEEEEDGNSARIASTKDQTAPHAVTQHSPEKGISRHQGTKRRLSEMSQSDDVAVLDSQEPLARMRQRMVQFHPQNHPLFVPPASITATAPSLVTPASSWDAIELFRELSAQGNSGFVGQFSNDLQENITGTTTFTNDATRPLFQSIESPSPSRTTASLTAKASSICLTPEQLASAVSCTTSMAKVLSQQSTPKIKEQVALDLFRKECAVLYQKCMLQAGYPPREAQDRTLAYKQFACKAWSMESQRLRQLYIDLSRTGS